MVLLAFLFHYCWLLCPFNRKKKFFFVYEKKKLAPIIITSSLPPIHEKYYKITKTTPSCIVYKNPGLSKGIIWNAY